MLAARGRSYPQGKVPLRGESAAFRVARLLPSSQRAKRGLAAVHECAVRRARVLLFVRAGGHRHFALIAFERRPPLWASDRNGSGVGVRVNAALMLSGL